MESFQQKRYTKIMRILFVEDFPLHNDTWSVQPVRSLSEAAVHAGDICAVYGDAKHLYQVKKYPAVRPGGLFHREAAPGRTQEEDLASSGYLDRSFLRKDIEALNSAIDEFTPDLIVDFGRVTSSVCARLNSVPWRTVINGAVFRKHSVRPEYLRAFNRVLSDEGLEQILKLRDLYDSAEKRFILGSLSADPVPEDTDVIRVGGSFLHDTGSEEENGVGIILTGCTTRPGKLSRIIRDTFLGAPYKVYVTLAKDSPSEGNIEQSPVLKTGSIKDRSVIIHDGNRYVWYECLCRGIPQIIINDSSWVRNWLASGVTRNGTGLQINEKELSVASLYETYRRLVSDDYYRIRCGYLKKETEQLPRFTSIIG